MDRNNPFFRQVELLVRTLPIVALQPCFALKGGTAINLFVRELPRLSVDIDLAYLPVEERETSLAAIDLALGTIKQDIEHRLGAEVRMITLKNSNKRTRLHITLNGDTVKLEVTPVLRGSVFPAEIRQVKQTVEETFGFAEMQLLGFEDLYAGKLCAALDRQHPRDLFDVKLLLENEGIDKKLIKVFLVYLIAHNRPMAELLNPNFADISASYQSEFVDTMMNPAKQAELENTRQDLVRLINLALTDGDKRFLLSVKNLEPDWEYLGLEHVKKLPGVRWKLHNLEKMNQKKRLLAVEKLENVLYG